MLSESLLSSFASFISESSHTSHMAIDALATFVTRSASPHMVQPLPALFPSRIYTAAPAVICHPSSVVHSPCTQTSSHSFAGFYEMTRAITTKSLTPSTEGLFGNKNVDVPELVQGAVGAEHGRQSGQEEANVPP